MAKFIDKVKQKYFSVVNCCGKYVFIFYLIMTLAITFSIVLAYFTHGKSLENMLFCNPTDTYMDFFNSIQYGRHPYERGVIYPPLMNAIYAFFGHFVSYDDIVDHGTVYIRSTQAGLMSFFGFVFLSLVFLFCIIKKVYSENEKENLFFSIIMTFSLPFLFAIDRGNSIILCLDFLMVFYYFHDSDNKVLKHIALMSLAIATAMKIYVVIFGCLILRKKNWKDAVWCCGYGIFFFFAPFLLMRGESRSFIKLIQNILNTVSIFSDEGYACKLNISAVLNIFNQLTGLDFTILSTAISMLIIVTAAISFFNSNFEEWKLTFMLSAILICIPGFSFTYTLVFLLIPLIDFLRCIRKKDKIAVGDYIYLILFAALFIPISIKDNGYLDDFFFSIHNYLTWSTIIEIVLLYLMLLMLSIESVISFMKKSSVRNRILAAVPIVLVGVLLAFQLTNLEEVSEKSNKNNTAFAMNQDAFSELTKYIEYDDNVFCFPSVPKFIGLSDEESEEINTDRWQSAIVDDELIEFTLNENNIPDVIITSTFIDDTDDNYMDYMKELFDFGYMCDYKNIGVFSYENSDSFEIWIKQSNDLSQLFQKNSGLADDPYSIKNDQDLLEFNEKVNNGWNFSGRTVRLDNDIDLSGINWIPIGNAEKGYAFSGNFNGNGHIISNIHIGESQRLRNAALFDFMNGVIYNLGLSGGSISGQLCSSFAAYSSSGYGEVINCFSTVSLNGEECGLFAGKFGGRIECCYYNGTVNAEKKHAMAFNNGDLRITDCFINKNISENNGMEKMDFQYLNNYLVDEEVFNTVEFADAINSTLINRGFFGIKLLKYEYDPLKKIVSHSRQWIYEIDTKSLYVTALNGEAEEESSLEDDDGRTYGVTVEPQHIQYGPYYPLEKGKYKITVYGDNLKSGKFDVHSHKMEYTADVKITANTDNFVEYTVTLPFDIEDVEFRFTNDSKDTAYIYNVFISSIQ